MNFLGSGAKNISAMDKKVELSYCKLGMTDGPPISYYPTLYVDGE